MTREELEASLAFYYKLLVIASWFSDNIQPSDTVGYYIHTHGATISVYNYAGRKKSIHPFNCEVVGFTNRETTESKIDKIYDYVRQER